MNESTDDEEIKVKKGGNTYYNLWGDYVPDTILLQIFQHLNAIELLRISSVCHTWYRVADDEFLWRDLLCKDFSIDKTIGLPPNCNSFKREYYRLVNEVPIVQTEILKNHSHQVLHVSFSNNGKMFATCSKDGEIIVWNSKFPASMKYQRDMKEFSWKYTQFSQFNSSDSLLLVSGVHFGTPTSTSGEIAVFSLHGGFNLQCRMANKPYDIFGTWYNDRYLISGDLVWLAHLVSSSILWLNKASQETSSEHKAIMNQLFKFYNRNASSVRSIMVADCLTSLDTGLQKTTSGNSPSSYCCPYYDRPSTSKNTYPPAVSLTSSDENNYASPIQYCKEYRLAENPLPEVNKHETTFDSEDEDEMEMIKGKDSDTEDDELLDTKDKYLIFTTGSLTFTPHQIAFKRIKPVHFKHRLDPGPSLKERIAERQRRRAAQAELEMQGLPPLEPNWLDFDSVSDRFDKIDHCIDLNGHIIGMALSPDHRYLYVNSRPWPIGADIDNPLDPPPIAQEIDIHVIDLVTLEEVGTMLRSHRAYTPNNECFFIFLDVSNQYVASGAEDKHGYLWDRHYGTCLAMFPHDDVVNSVAFNPKNAEMLVTVSDDNTVKVWRSRKSLSKIIQLGKFRKTDLKFKLGKELRKMPPIDLDLQILNDTDSDLGTSRDSDDFYISDHEIDA